MMEINVSQQHVRRRVNPMRDRLHQHQQLQRLFIDGGSLGPAHGTVISNIANAPYSDVDATANKCVSQQDDNESSNNLSTSEMQSAGANGVIISTHYYTSTGGRRTYHNYYYNYGTENDSNAGSNNDSSDTTHVNSTVSTNMTSENSTSSESSNNRRQTKRPNSEIDVNVTPKKPLLMNSNNNNSNNNVVNNNNNNPHNSLNRTNNNNNNSNSTSNANANSSNSIDSTNNDNNSSINVKSNNSNSIVDSAMLHAIREKVLHSPAGTNFDVMSVSTPNGGRTIATHSSDQLQLMRIFDHENAEPGPVLTSSVPVSLLKERYLISHVPQPQKPAASNTFAMSPHIEPLSGTMSSSHPNNGAGVCPTGSWYRHLVDVSTTSLRCTDIFSEEEYICKVINEPLAKVRLAYYKLQEDKDCLRSTLYGHRLVRAAQDIVPYVSAQGEASTERTYVIVAPQTATAEEIQLWTGGDTRSGTIGMGGRVTGAAIEDLHSYIRRKRRLCELEVRALFHQICETVRLCHRNGIILRDLKLKRFYFIDNERYVYIYNCL